MKLIAVSPSATVSNRAPASDLRYAGESALPDGGRQQEQLTFAPLAGGRVHQLWKQSQDDGRSWTVAFDGTYVPRRGVATVEPTPE